MRNASTSTWRAFYGSRWFLLGGIVLFLLLSFAFGRAYYRNYLINQQIADMRQELARIKGRRLETLELLQRAQSLTFVEERARTELNLRKEGELMAIIESPGTSHQPRQAERKVVESEKVSNPVRWWRYFFK